MTAPKKAAYTHPYADQSKLHLGSGIIGQGRDDMHIEWHWTLIHANGLNVATSGETYVDKSHAIEMAEKLFPGIVWDDSHTPDVAEPVAAESSDEA